VFGAIYRTVTGRNGRVFIVLAALVVSHWILDWISHRPDMPIYPGGPKFGLGLWNHVAATIIVEGIMFAAGIWIYVRATRARDAVGPMGLRQLDGISGGPLRRQRPSAVRHRRSTRSSSWPSPASPS